MSGLRRPRQGFVVMSVLGLMLGGRAAFSGDWRVGALIGYGGSSVSKTETPGGTSALLVVRNQNPGALLLTLDYVAEDFWSLGLVHQRGLELGPLSSGISFTGLAARWYFLAPIPPRRPEPGPINVRMIHRRFVPYVLGASGLAFGEVSREGELVATVKNSGIYIQGGVGVEYPLQLEYGLRAEMSYATSIQSGGGLSMMAIVAGLCFSL
jgi:hypothetical protein